MTKTLRESKSAVEKRAMKSPVKKASPRAVVPIPVSIVSIDDKIDQLAIDISIVRHNVLGIYDMLSTLFEDDNCDTNKNDEDDEDDENDEDDGDEGDEGDEDDEDEDE